MSNKEIAKSIIDTLPECKMAALVAFLKGMQYDDEIEDEMFCRRMLDDYLADDSPDKHEAVSIEQLADELGVEL